MELQFGVKVLTMNCALMQDLQWLQLITERNNNGRLMKHARSTEALIIPRFLERVK